MSYDPNNKLTFDPAGHLVLSTSPTVGDNSTKAATTSFVQAVFSNSYTPSAIAITGGTINNVPVGATSASSGAFTTATMTTLTAPSASVSGLLSVNGAWVRKTRTVTSGATIAMVSTDDVLIVNKTTGSATTVTLPASPTKGMRVVVKDAKGDAATNNITVQPAAGTIDGSATFLINAAYGFGDFIYDGTQWSAFTQAGTGTIQQESVDGTTLNSTTGTITASNVTGQADSGPTFNTFALLTDSSAPPFSVSLNGVNDAVTGNVLALVYHNHGVFQHASDNSTFDDWWYYDTTLSPAAWTEYAVSSVTLSSTSFAQNAPANTVIGTITVTMSNSRVLSNFSGTLSVSDTTNFKIVGSQLQANTTLNQSSYSITITATPSLVGNPFTTTAISLTQTGGTTAINYGTNPTTAGFGNPLPLSSKNVAGQATSPLGWQVDLFDDFTGTLNFVTVSSWTTSRGTPNGFTTGATYNGQLIKYVYIWTAAWGGYSGTDVITNITMANSKLNFPCQLSGTTFQTSQATLSLPTSWGYHEASLMATHGANGSRTGCDLGFWLSGYPWPQMGELDCQESGGTAGILSFIHHGATSDSAVSLANSSNLGGNGTYDDGNFHVYGALLTPAYIAIYVDGTLINWGNSTAYLSGNSTATYPPFSNSAGNFGYQQNTVQGTPSNPAYFTGSNVYMFFGYEVGSGFTNALAPMHAQCDFIRHSILFPQTGGAHV